MSAVSVAASALGWGRRSGARRSSAAAGPAFSGMLLEAPGMAEDARRSEAAARRARRGLALRVDVRALVTSLLDLAGLAMIPVGIGVWLGAGLGLVVGGLAALWLSARLS